MSERKWNTHRPARRRVMFAAERTRQPASRGTITEMGVVLAHVLGSNRADVRLGEGDNRVIRRVTVPTDMRLNVDDRVAIIKSAGESGWLVVNKYSTTRESGLDQGDVGRHCEPTATLWVQTIGAGVVATWSTWTDYPVCWEVQYNASPTEAGAETIWTWQNQWVLGSVIEMFFRVRVIYISPRTTGTFYGPWSTWESGSPTPIPPL